MTWEYRKWQHEYMNTGKGKHIQKNIIWEYRKWHREYMNTEKGKHIQIKHHFMNTVR